MKQLVTIFALMPTLCFAQWTQLGNSINGDQANARFGWSTAISGNGSVVAVGAIFNSSAFSSAGQVRVFGLSNGIWGQIGGAINGESSGDQTGQSLCLSSDGSVLGNPVKNNLNVTGLKPGGTLTLFDNAGKMLLQRNVQDQSFSIDISFLSSGVYHLRYWHNGSIENARIIKQ